MVANDLSSAARPLVGTVRGLLGDWLPWVIAACLGTLTVLVAGLADDVGNPASMLVFAVLPIAVASLALTVMVRRAAFLAAAALIVAISPTVQALSGGRWQGAAAVVAAVVGASMAWTSPHLTRSVQIVLGGLLSLLLLVTWIWRTPRALPTPTWATIVSDTGRRLWETVGTVGSLTRIPMSAWLAWWLAVGLIAGAALLVGQWRAAATVFSGIGVIVVAGWLISRWRGSVDMSGGMWIICGSLAFAGSSTRLEPPAARRVAGGIAALVAIIWVLTLVHLARV